MRLRKIAPMSSSTRTFATLVVATQSGSDDGYRPETIQGFALLEVQRRDTDTWSFALKSAVVQTAEDDAEVLRQLADCLPRADFLVGEDIERSIVAPIETATSRLDPILAAYVRCRFARLQAALPVDLAVGRIRLQTSLFFLKSSPATPPLTFAAEDGATVDVDRSRVLIETRVIEDWLRFLSKPQGPMLATAKVATITWLTAR